MFDYLEDDSHEEFLKGFPTVKFTNAQLSG